MAIDWKEHIRELLSPLPIASYLAWGAIWYTSAGSHSPGWLVEASLLLFLAAWLGCLLCSVHQHPWLSDGLLLLLTASALAVLALQPDGSTPILLILLAVQYANRFAPLGVAISFVLVNSVFAALLFWRFQMPAGPLLGTMAAYASFQLFALLVMRYAHKAEQMAEQLQQVNAHLLATRELLSETARDQERLRLSRELHDVAGHKLTALRLNLRALSVREDLRDCRELQLSSQLAGELLEDLRSVVRQLRQDDGIDLARGLQRLAEPLPRPALRLDIADNARVPKAEQAEVLLRIAQEGLTNAARHSQAKNVFLQLQRNGQALCLTLDDDGRVQWPIRHGNGLTGMRERIEALGGELGLRPSSRGGLHISATLPLEAA